MFIITNGKKNSSPNIHLTASLETCCDVDKIDKIQINYTYVCNILFY